LDLKMNEPQLKFVQCLSASGLHRMAYWEWAYRGEDLGHEPAPVLVCVHGLSRQGRDFDVLARRMTDRYRVICPDVVGRGRSDWLLNPAGYQVPSYVSDMVTLLARLDTDQVDWVGTSMGGLIGMGLAALPSRSGHPLRRLVLNDVGPVIAIEALQRIGSYLGLPLHFDTPEQGAAYLWTIAKSFGPGLKLHYDPQIAAAFAAVTPDMAAAGSNLMWHVYDAIRCPTLLLRGADSDLLALATAQAMTERGPKAQLHQFAGVGHAPTLVQDDQIAVLREFLLAPQLDAMQETPSAS
jgi:pimeloyl-ACP methyl ester carboxylesterase